MDSQGCNQLRLAARLQTKVERASGVHNLFHDLPELVHLYRKHPFVGVLVIRFGDRGMKSTIYRFNAMPEQILESYNEWKRHSLLARFRNNLHQVNRISIALGRHDLNISSSIYSEVTGAPTINVVERYSGRDIPRFSHRDAKLSDAFRNSMQSFG